MLVAHSWTKLVDLPTTSGQEPGRDDGLSPCVTRAACCAAQQHVQHHAPRRAALLDYIGTVAPGGVKRDVAIAPVIRPALR